LTRAARAAAGARQAGTAGPHPRSKISTGLLANPRPGTPSDCVYCYGWGRVKLDWADAPFLTHNGSNSINFAKILIDPNRDVAITNFLGSKANDASNAIVETHHRKFV
jgi:hypothetical protein